MPLRVFFSELRLYVCNHIVASVPSRRLRMMFYRRIMRFNLGEKTSIFLNCRFDCTERLTIGSPSAINQGCRLDSRGGLTIGNNVSISEEVCILTADHDPKADDFSGRPRPVVIEDYVFVGTRAMILPGVTIHRGAIVAAGAVVSRDVKALDIVGGVPARSIGTRNPDFPIKLNIPASSIDSLWRQRAPILFLTDCYSESDMGIGRHISARLG
jgi:maltose O-acetyltransferase